MSSEVVKQKQQILITKSKSLKDKTLPQALKYTCNRIRHHNPTTNNRSNFGKFSLKLCRSSTPGLELSGSIILQRQPVVNVVSEFFFCRLSSHWVLCELIYFNLPFVKNVCCIVVFILTKAHCWFLFIQNVEKSLTLSK